MLQLPNARRSRVVLTTLVSVAAISLIAAPIAGACTWQSGDGSGSTHDKPSTSYYPGSPLGPIGSAEEDAKCDADDLCTGDDRDGDGRYDYIKSDSSTAGSTTTTIETTTTAKPSTTIKSTTTAKPMSQGIQENAFLTGYSWEDNTPRGSRDISDPVVHGQAAGKGTFNDPITLAVGHSINPTKMRFAPGTKFYVPMLRAYFVVEDTCGDGNTPQNGGCWTGYPAGASYWIDLYLGSDPTDKCMDSITGVHTVIRNPDAGWMAVERRGDVGSTYYGVGADCKLYSDTPTRK
jgi:hypothetical protein